MKNEKQTRKPVTAARTRYFLLTRYEGGTGREPESNDAAESTRNFPSTFIPMIELEESPAAD